VRRSFTRGGIQPSSKAEFRPRGRPTLERGGVSPEGASSSRARRSFARGGRWGRPFDGPLGSPDLWASFLYRAVICVKYGCQFAGSFVLLFAKKMGFSPVVRGPLWLSPTKPVPVSTVTGQPLRPAAGHLGLRECRPSWSSVVVC
jgi:hypothetical protein